MNRIQEYLDKQERSQGWLAKKIGVSRQVMSNWCINKSQPKFGQMVFIAKHLKVRDVRKMYKEDNDV